MQGPDQLGSFLWGASGELVHRLLDLLLTKPLQDGYLGVRGWRAEE